MGLRTRTRPSDRSQPDGGRFARVLGADEAIAVVAVLVAIVGALLVPRAPSTIRSLTVTNPSAYDVQIEIGNPDHGGWMPLGAVDAGATAVFLHVLDQGGHWGLRYRAQGVDGGEQDLARAELGAAQWHVTVPDASITQWRDRQVAASPCSLAHCPAP